FAVLLPECDAQQALEVSERLRRAMARRPFETPTGIAVPVTISIGVAVHDPSEDHSTAHGDELQAMMHVADQNLYHAKTSGRNQIVGPAPHQ
uniref:GGDEF domain-containing protein n=1 Tax=Aquisalimonas sp. TaxID=1872621 RepID=UPI0025C1CC2D